MKDNNEDENIKIPKIILKSALAGLTATLLLNWHTFVDKFEFSSKEQISEELEKEIDNGPSILWDVMTDETFQLVENVGFKMFDLNETAKKEFGDMGKFRKALGIPDTVTEENISPEAYATALQWQKQYWFFTTKDDSNIQAIPCNMFGYKFADKEEQKMVQIPSKKLFAGRKIKVENGDYYLIKYDFRNDKYALISKNDVDLNIANTFKTKQDVKIKTEAFGEQTLKKGTEIKLIGNEAIYWIDEKEYQVEAKEIKDQINEKNSMALNKQPIYIYAKGISEYYKKGDSKNRVLGSDVQYDINTNKLYVTTYSLNGFGINIETKDLVETSSSLAIQEELDEAIGYQGGNYYTNNNNNYVSNFTSSQSVSNFTSSQMQKNARHNYVQAFKNRKGDTNEDEKYTKYLGLGSSAKDQYCAAAIMRLAYDNGVPEDVIPQGAQYASCAVMYKFFEKQGLIVKNDGSYIPQEGDIVFFDSDGDSEWINHVGVVTDSKEGKFSTVEGNTTGGKVSVYDLKYKIGDNKVDNSGKMKPMWFAKVPWNNMVPEQEKSQTQVTIKGEITADDVDIGLGFNNEQSKNAQDVANILRQKNIDLIHMAGIWANIYHESSFHIAAKSSDGYDSIGYCQWTEGRKTALLEYTEKYNKEHGTNYDWRNTLVQMDYLLYGDPDTYGDKRTIEAYLETDFKDAREAAMWFCEHWERPEYIDPNRGETAQKFYNNIIKNHQKNISFNKKNQKNIILSSYTKQLNEKDVTNFDWNKFVKQVEEFLCKAEDKEIEEKKERYYGQIIEENKKGLAFRSEER
ncbi:MAG: CHAP domain-containing protein [Clostridia bacterium]|nr:CHAP domain-containing protein [Clostridia bacterium]